MNERVCRAVEGAGATSEISDAAAATYWTEWNVPGMLEARDTIYVGPAVANTVRQCDGNLGVALLLDLLRRGLEEGGPIDRPFLGMFGLRAQRAAFNKPSYYGYALLHQLGDRRIANAPKDVIVTKTKDGGSGDSRLQSGRARSTRFSPDRRAHLPRRPTEPPASPFSASMRSTVMF